MTTLPLARDLALPLEAVTEVLGFLGRRGQGKSYAAQLLAELMHAAGAQFVALDPVGIWWGLRLAANGKDPGIPIPVFGGLNGDVPLEPTGGKLVADVIADRGISAVVDVSQFESDAARNRFVHDFGQRFYQRRKATPAAVHLFLEEAQEFVPQSPMGDGEKGTLNVLQRVAKLGRNYGIGVSLISQRPQEVHKKVLNLTELLFAFQLTGPHERKAVKGWIQEKGLSEDLDAILPKLKRGQPHAWSPAWLEISRVVAIGTRWTFDASSTPRVGTAAKRRELSPIDLVQLREAMAATLERARAEDPKALRQRIHTLERELQAATRATPAPTVERREVPVIPPAQATKYDRAVMRLDGVAGRLFSAIEQLQPAAVAFRETAVALRAALERVRNGRRDTPPAPRPLAEPVAKVPRTPMQRRSAGWEPKDPTLGKRERAALTVLAQFPDGCRAGKLALLAGYRYGGGFRTGLSTIRSKGYIEGENTGVMRITEDGIDALGAYEPLPAGQDLVAYWLTHRSLGKRERSALGALLEHPEGLTGEELAAAAGYEWGGGFRTGLSTLRTAGLLVGKNTERMRAMDELLEAAQ